jgi:hypothetical protein
MAVYQSCREDLGHAPGIFQYDGWRYRQMQSGDEANFLPSAPTLSRRLGGGEWSGVARSAGVSLPLSRRSRREFGDDELAHAWRACAVDRGHPPTEVEYDVWREAQLTRDETRHLPCSYTLVRRLGGGTWSGVAATLGVETSRQRSRRAGGDCSLGELTRMWRACADELGHPPSIGEYMRWREQRMARDRAGHVAHHKTLTERLGGGSWPAIAARLGVDYAPRSGPLSSSYADDELSRAWRAASAELGHSPTEAEHSEWRARRRDRATIRLPHAHTLASRLGHGAWPRAGARSGCAEGAAGHASYNDDQLADAWWRCSADLGHIPSQYDYDSWRAKQLTRADAALLPHYKTLARRLGGGSWPGIARRMQGVAERHVER